MTNFNEMVGTWRRDNIASSKKLEKDLTALTENNDLSIGDFYKAANKAVEENLAARRAAMDADIERYFAEQQRELEEENKKFLEEMEALFGHPINM